MQKDQKVQARHLNPATNELVEFTLVATALKRQGKDSAPKFYPFFSETDLEWSNLTNIFGEEMLQELAVDALTVKFQQLYFQRSPSGEQVPVIKDGKPQFITDKDGKQVAVTQKDETPRMAEFLEFIKDSNLSSRQITVEYCMRKAIAIQTGLDKKYANASETEKLMASMEWIKKSQELAAQAIQASKE